MQREITGIILSGGLSSRMGRDKGLVRYKNKPLIEYAIEALKPICNEVLISANQQGYKKYALPIIKDSFKEMGPLGGLYEGLKAARNNWILVLSCDLPNINSEIAGQLFEKLPENNDAIVASFKGRVQPLFGIYNKRLLNIVEQHLTDHKLKMMRFLDQIAVDYISFDHMENQVPNLFDNINTLSDIVD